MSEILIAVFAKRSRDEEEEERRVMFTIFPPVFDMCSPFGLFGTSAGSQPKTTQPMEKTKRDEFWDKKCEANPVAPGCKDYEI